MSSTAGFSCRLAHVLSFLQRQALSVYLHQSLQESLVSVTCWAAILLAESKTPSLIKAVERRRQYDGAGEAVGQARPQGTGGN